MTEQATGHLGPQWRSVGTAYPGYADDWLCGDWCGATLFARTHRHGSEWRIEFGNESGEGRIMDDGPIEHAQRAAIAETERAAFRRLCGVLWECLAVARLHRDQREHYGERFFYRGHAVEVWFKSIAQWGWWASPMGDRPPGGTGSTHSAAHEAATDAVDAWLASLGG